MEYKDYYKALGVEKTATQDEIKSAYRKLARKHHPDMNPDDPKAEDRFKDINEAYQALSDPEKRQKYDQFGSQYQQFRNGGGQPDDFWSQWTQQPSGSSSRRTMSQEELGQMFGGGLGGFSDFFETLFGSGMGGFGSRQTTTRQQAQPRPRKIQDMEHPTDITLEEAYSGTMRTLSFEDGRKIEAQIPPGVNTGARIRLSGQVKGSTSNVQAGDLYLKIKVLPHKTFTRDGNDLKITLPIDLYTALLGGEVSVPTIGKPVRLTIPEGTDGGKVFRLKNLGMPLLKKPDTHGNLYVTVEIKLPKHLTQAEKDKFEELKKMRR